MAITLLSLLAGALSALAPCVLPFLPVIVGGNVSGGSRWRPYLIAAGLAVSLVAFTVLLKATTAFIDVDPRVWTISSGLLVILLGLAMLFPDAWARLATALRLDERSHAFLERAQRVGERARPEGSDGASAAAAGPAATASTAGATTTATAVRLETTAEAPRGRLGAIAGPLLIGAALGPVFSSCSPTHAWIIATVLPADAASAAVDLAAYCLGMVGMLLAVSLLGRRLIARLGWAASPRGWFQKTIACLFIVVGVLVASGVDKEAQAWAADHVPGLTAVEERLLPEQAGADAEASGRPAPELAGLTEWINSDPLTLAELRGRVVLVDFWTYSCMNCVRTQPYLNAWYERSHEAGFDIIGVHAPEFAVERLPENVRQAVADAGIRYPVALDNDFATWRAYGNRYWPAKYLIDQQGNVVWTHFREGGYDEAEARIRELLGAEGAGADPAAGQDAATSAGQSPETYFGAARARGFLGSPALAEGEHGYAPAEQLQPDEWTLGGRWFVDGESIASAEDGATLSYRFAGREMYLVMDGAGAGVSVALESGAEPGGQDVVGGVVAVDGARLYRIVSLPSPTAGTTVTVTVPEGVRLNAAAFG